MERRGPLVVVVGAAAAVVVTFAGVLAWLVAHPPPASRAARSDAGVDADVPPPDDGFAYADADVRVDPGPAVLRAEVPRADEHGTILWDAAHVPRGHLVGQVCAGNGEMLDRLARATRGDPDVLHAVMAYAAPFEDCYATRYCGWARHAATDAARPESERALAWWALTTCDDAESTALFARPDMAVPALAFARRADHETMFREEPAEWNDLFATALHEELGILGTPRGAWTFRGTVVLVAHIPGPRAGAALLSLYDEAPLEKRSLVGAAMFLRHDARSVALHAAACDPALPDRDSLCRWRPLPPRQNHPSANLAQSLAENRVDASDTARDESIALADRTAALSDCVERTTTDRPWTSVSCLDALAGLDLAVARRVASRLVDHHDFGVRALARSVVRFASPAELGARLDALGLGALAPPPSAEVYSGWDVQHELEQRGRILTFDAETDRFPNEHDTLLAELGALGGDALAGVAFRERAPPDDEEETGPYVLHAFAAGRVYRTDAHNYGDYYDLDAVLGLLDTVARALGSDARWMSIESGDQIAIVLGGPAAALRSLADEGLLVRGEPSEARQSGQGADSSLDEK